MEYNNFCDKDFYQYEGRILEKDGVAYLGYTNSYVRFYAKGNNVRAFLISNITEDVNMAGLSVFLDDCDEAVNKLVVDKEEAWYDICELPDDKEHLVTIVKITEAAMSHVGLVKLQLENGELLKREFPQRSEFKIEFQRSLIEMEKEGVTLDLGNSNPSIAGFDGVYMPPTLPESAPIAKMISNSNLKI